MSFIEEVKQRAKQEIKTIVLPEAKDIRILQATEQVLKEQYANIVLIGNPEKIEKKAKENNIAIKGAQIVDPNNSEKYDSYTNLLYELRKHKGMTIEKAKELVKDPVYYGMLMVKDEKTRSRWIGFRRCAFYIRYAKTSFTNFKNCSRYQISFCFFRYGCTRLRIWGKGNFYFCG